MNPILDLILPENKEATRKYLENYKLRLEKSIAINTSLTKIERIKKIFIGIYYFTWLIVGISCFFIFPFIIWIPLSFPCVIYWIKTGRSLFEDLNEKYNFK